MNKISKYHRNTICRQIPVLLLAILLCPVILTAFYAPPAFAYDGPPLIYDEPGLLSSTEKYSLTSAAETISDQYDCSVAAIFVNSINGYRDIMDFADDFYDSNGYGANASKDGIMLVVSMQERRTRLVTGGKGIDIFTDYGLELVENSFLTRLSAGDYSGAVEKYISKCGELMQYYKENGSPVDNVPGSSSQSSFSPVGLAAAFGVGALTGGLPLSRQKKSLKSVQSKANAADYKTGKLRLTINSDRFINRNVTRVRRSQDNQGRGGSGFGGSSVHFSSSGVSHGGRSGSF